MNTEQLIRDIKARFSHNSSKEYLKEKYNSKLIFADQGGLWKTTPEFISFLTAHINTTAVLLDNYDNPIKVNTTQLLAKASSIYKTVMEEWYNEFEELKNKR